MPLVLRRRWLVDRDGHQTVRGLASPTWGLTRCWTFKGAQRKAHRWSRRQGESYEVFGPIGKDLDGE